MTSNLGADLLKKGTGLGFNPTKDDKVDYEKLKSQILDASKKTFKPELLNRLDDVIVFRQLAKEDMSAILDNELLNVKERLESHHITLILSPEARDFLISKGYDPLYGARPMRRTIERHVEDPLAEQILRGHIKRDSRVDALLKDDKLEFVAQEKPEDEPALPAAG